MRELTDDNREWMMFVGSFCGPTRFWTMTPPTTQMVCACVYVWRACVIVGESSVGTDSKSHTRLAQAWCHMAGCLEYVLWLFDKLAHGTAKWNIYIYRVGLRI